MSMVVQPFSGPASAAEDFARARRRAAMEEIIARLTRKSAALLSYDEVSEKLRASGATPRGVQEIPLDAIVGSVGRYTDFTRSFLPRLDSDQARWVRIETAPAGLAGLPPIQVYQIGQAYFVLDGNHRVSVARQQGLTFIMADVTEVHTKVSLSPDVQPDDLIIKAEAAAFLEATGLDKSRPGADLSVSIPGQYAKLENHIEVRRYLIEEELGREISFEEAAARWYDEDYAPVVEVAREQGILRDFPNRTETDLYLWISQHRLALEQELGLEVRPESVASNLAHRFSPRPDRIAARLGRKILSVVRPEEFDPGSPPGQWRKEHLAARPDGRLFADVLVGVRGEEAGWRALDQAIEIARREQAVLNGFHAAHSEEALAGDRAEMIQREFDLRCQAAGVTGKLSFDVGQVARSIYERSWWVDLIVLSLSYPPAPQPIAKLASGFRTILRQCSRPVLAVPGPASALSRALLAYDGSPRADEALFVAAYLAGQWNTSLVVVTVATDRIRPEVQRRAHEYLVMHDVRAAYVLETGPIAEAILQTAEEHHSDLIIMGNYGPHPLLEVVKGSAVDDVLRASRQPILICR
jgi:nucleotide-binding universal stress UspA family protein